MSVTQVVLLIAVALNAGSIALNLHAAHRLKVAMRDWERLG